MCRFCQKSFTRESVLNVHLEMVHSKELALEATEDDDEFGDLEEVEEDDYEEIQESNSGREEVIEISPDFYQSSEEDETLAPKPPIRYQAVNIHGPGPPSRAVVSPQKLSNSAIFEGQQQKRSLLLQQRLSAGVSTNVQPPRLKTGESSSEEDEGLPRNANIIIKRSGSMEDDEDWDRGKSKLKKVKLEDGAATRTSSRIRIKRDKSDEEQAKEETGNSDSNQTEHSDYQEESNSNGSEEKVESATEAGDEKLETNEVAGVHNKSESGAIEAIKPKEPMELVEPCIVAECPRKFYGFFSMMRHVAFTHNREKTMRIMKLIPPDGSNAKYSKSKNGQNNPLLRI